MEGVRGKTYGQLLQYMKQRKSQRAHRTEFSCVKALMRWQRGLERFDRRSQVSWARRPTCSSLQTSAPSRKRVPVGHDVPHPSSLRHDLARLRAVISPADCCKRFPI